MKEFSTLPGKMLLCLALASIGGHASASENPAAPVRYVATPTGYLMVLRQGDNVLDHLNKLAEREQIPSASFSGMGFAGTATFGFYDFGRKEFDPRSFEAVEVASLTGTLAWQQGKPSIHAHGLVTDANFQTFGGHLLGLVVGTGSMEITLIVHDKKLERAIDPTIEANILGL